MARYFIDFVSTLETLADPEGSEFPTLEVAKNEAIQDIRDLMAEAIRTGRDISSRRAEIRDATGALVATIPFADAIRKED